MMLSQSVLVAVSDFLMQFSPAGSLHTKYIRKLKLNRNESEKSRVAKGNKWTESKEDTYACLFSLFYTHTSFGR